MDFQSLGRLLVILAVAMAVLGGLLMLGGAFGLGSFPGDLRFGREGWGCYVPIVSSIIISVVLTLLLNLLLRFFRH